MPRPILRLRLIAELEAAGFTHSELRVPTYPSGGMFRVREGEGAVVEVEWWGSSVEERRGLLERMRVALEAAGYVVSDRGDGLYVPAEE